MSLPETWVDRIFEKLALVYGHQFLARWDGMDLARVKADWGHELRRFAQSPAAIAHGLEQLPADRPPTVLQFRDLCDSHRPPTPRIGHDEAPADPKRVAQELAKLRSQPNNRTGDRREWARVIVARHRAGGKVTSTVLRIASECLALAGGGATATAAVRDEPADGGAPW